MIQKTKFTLVAGALLAFASTGALAGEMAKLPDQVTVVAYDVGTSGYNVTMAFTGAYKEKLGTNLRILPGKNDVARVSLLQKRTADFGALGSDAVYVQEGLYTFGKRKFGPTPVRLIAMNINKGSSAFLTAADANVKVMSDIRGKRVALIKGSAVSRNFTAAYLAFGGLTWDDVKPVIVSSFGDANRAIIDGRVDGTVSNTNSSVGRQLEASPRGTRYIPFPHNDTEGWKRLNSIIPWMYKHIATTGPTIPKTGVEMAASPYPVLVTLADQDADLAYNMTKAIFELYPLYKDSVRGAEGWAISSQKLEETFLPLHDGAVRYYKEAGVWTDKAEAKQKLNLKRQVILAKTWATYSANAPSDDAAFEKRWQAARAEALTKAGMTLIEKSW